MCEVPQNIVHAQNGFLAFVNVMYFNVLCTNSTFAVVNGKNWVNMCMCANYNVWHKLPCATLKYEVFMAQSIQ